MLLVSVDGLHALDLAKCAAAQPEGTLARLAKAGVTRRQAMAPLISDSFPGLAAQATGGGPATTGVNCDDSHARAAFPPGSACRGEAGTEVPFAPAIDVDPSQADVGGTIRRPMTQIDPRSSRCARRRTAACRSARTTTCAPTRASRWCTRAAAAGPGMKLAAVAGPIGTAEIAPTILKALGYAPEELRAVKAEGTPPLPNLPF